MLCEIAISLAANMPSACQRVLRDHPKSFEYLLTYTDLCEFGAGNQLVWSVDPGMLLHPGIVFKIDRQSDETRIAFSNRNRSVYKPERENLPLNLWKRK